MYTYIAVNAVAITMTSMEYSRKLCAFVLFNALFMFYLASVDPGAPVEIPSDTGLPESVFVSAIAVDAL